MCYIQSYIKLIQQLVTALTLKFIKKDTFAIREVK